MANDSHFGRLDMPAMERLERVLSERSQGTYSTPVLHGMLTASVVGPEPVPLDYVVQTVLNPPESEGIGFDAFPEFEWVKDETKELHRRIKEVFAGDPETYQLFVHMPRLAEGDDTPDPKTWCNGFVEGMADNRDQWKPLLEARGGFEMAAPILMTSDPEEWEHKDVLNPFPALAPLELCEGIKLAVLAIHSFWQVREPTPSRMQRPPRISRNAPCPCGSGKKYKQCCGRGA
jgi:yecA family protein